MTPEQYLVAALDGMPELAEALAELRQWESHTTTDVPSTITREHWAAYQLGVGRYRAGRLLKAIDRAAGQ